MGASFEFLLTDSCIKVKWWDFLSCQKAVRKASLALNKNVQTCKKQADPTNSLEGLSLVRGHWLDPSLRDLV